MPGPRTLRLWTGPGVASLLSRAIDEFGPDPTATWLVPSPSARARLERLLAGRSASVEPPKVYDWEAVWKSAAVAHPDPVARLSESGRMAVLSEAIERAGSDGSLDLLRNAVRFPGYRRRLLGRFDAWTLAERPVDGPPPGDSAATAEEWAIFGRYRAILRGLHAEDRAGWAVWASRSLASQAPPDWRKPGPVVAVDPIAPSEAQWRALNLARQRARSMTVLLPFDDDPGLAELFSPVERTRGEFLRWGFVEEPERPDLFSARPKGLDAIARELFRSDAHARPKLRVKPGQGLRVLGGPRGDGVALLVAREVRDRLDRGIAPDEVMVVVPRLDEDAERIRETLASWGLPVAPKPSRRLATDPAVSALRLAIRLPSEDWEASTLIRLLRNGQVRWPGRDGPFAPFEAASAIRATRIFRDPRAIRNALERALGDPKQGRSAKVALAALDRLSAAIDPAARPGPWRVQVERTMRLAEALGLDPGPLAPLWDALDDHGWVLDGLGSAVAEESRTWDEFAARVDAIVEEVATPAGPLEAGTIRVEAVDDALGTTARVVILANLAEESFPSSDAVDLDVPGPSRPVDADDEEGGAPAGSDPGYCREMLRFARVAGSAEAELILAYPTTDLDGSKLLPAGFLDDLLRRLDPESASSLVEDHPRFDPLLLGHRDLARSPTDARVLAVALAFEGRDHSALAGLSASPGHLGALEGTALAFEVAHHRRVEKTFGHYDGRLTDARTIARIREEFGPDHAFSPSQLESFALCPFQFFQRYVLGLKVVEERQELDEDYAGRGSDVHRVLETIHRQIAQEGGVNLLDRLAELIAQSKEIEIEQHDEDSVDLPKILREINTRRTNKALDRYAGQYRKYEEKHEDKPIPHQFEVVFGRPEDQAAGEGDTTASHPHLTIGEGDDAVRFQGVVDRIDLVTIGGRGHFRIVDYKTGSNPSPKDVHAGLASQLPLYALAVERLIFAEGEPAFLDAGYWSLPKNGFGAVKFKDWPDYRRRLTDFILAQVAALRRGTFPIHSQNRDCRKYCDYHSACRVGEVRLVGKAWHERPALEDSAP